MILVTGATGFTGEYVARLLAQQGERFRVFVRDAARARPLADLGADVAVGSFEDEPALQQAMSGCTSLLNIASIGFGHAPAIVRAAEAAGVERAVFVSSTALFTSLEARSKAGRLAAEEAIMNSRLAWTIIRPTMIYGSERDRNIYRLLRLLQRTPVIPVPGSGRGLQQPVHVTDVARAVVAALKTPAAVGKAYNIAGREPLTFDELIDTAAAALGRRVWKVHVPLVLIRGPVALLERMRPGRVPLKAEQLLRLAEDKAFSYQEATQDLDYLPLSFAEGVAREVALVQHPISRSKVF